MRVVIAEEAEIDLEDIADRIAVDSPVRALSFIRELRASRNGLADQPQAWTLVRGYEGRQVRRRVHGAYLIFFQVEATQVVVIRILHGACDFAAILFPDG